MQKTIGGGKSFLNTDGGDVSVASFNLHRSLIVLKYAQTSSFFHSHSLRNFYTLDTPTPAHLDDLNQFASFPAGCLHAAHGSRANSARAGVTWDTD